jgi:ribosomal protein L11 methyltransferase
MPVEGRSVFDVGTGSGILALVAVKLGAQTVRAVDVDDVAVRVARENFARNGYEVTRVSQSSWGNSNLQVEVGSAADAKGRQWDIVVANILAHILVDLMPDLAAALTPGGRLILSGMIAEQEDGLVAAAQKHRLQMVERRIEEDWIAMVVEHRD